MGEDDAQLTWPRSTQWPAGKDQADERALIRRELRPLVHTINKAIKQADGQLMLRSLRELIAQTEARDGDRWLWGAAQQDLGDVLPQIPAEDYEQSLDQALIAYKAALSIYSPEVCPVEWATTQNNLGNIYWLRKHGDPVDNIEQAIVAYKAALQVRTPTTDPYGWARTQNNLGNAYTQRYRGQKAKNQELAITAFQAALQVHKVELYADDYAMDQTNLGLTYLERINGVYTENLEQTMVCFLCAMLVYTPRTAPRKYRRLVNNLSDAFRARIEAAAPEVREQVIAVLGPVVRAISWDEELEETSAHPQPSMPADHSPAQVARAQSTRIPASSLFDSYNCDYYRAMPLYVLMDVTSSLHLLKEMPYRAQLLRIALSRADLGPSYRALFNRELGDTLSNIQTVNDMNIVENQKEAIAAYHAALEFYTSEEHLEQWARIQLHLAEVFRQRMTGERAENIERALGYCEVILSIRRRDLPDDLWGLCQAQLGRLYRDRIRGDPRKNTEEAIAAFKAALTVFTRETHPYEWARIQNSLGLTSREMQSGDKAENMEQAIAAFKAALTVFTRKARPYEWAGTQYNLAGTFQNRLKGNKTANLKRAIAAYTKSLSVWTKEVFPRDWAKVEYNLGSLYEGRISGEPTQNLEQSADYFRTALEVHTLEAMPEDHRKTAIALAEVEAELGHWLAAHEAYATAFAAEELLLGAVGTGVYGFDAIVKKGYEISTRDGFTLAQLGRLDEATVAIERGRARWLAESLKLDEDNIKRIQDPKRHDRFDKARKELIAIQAGLHMPYVYFDPGNADEQKHAEQIERVFLDPILREMGMARVEAFHAAKERFDAVVADIRRAQDPADFLLDTLDPSMILKAAEGLPGHALVYLIATPWGGLALAVLSADKNTDAQGRFVLLPLPDLTNVFVSNLVQVLLDDRFLVSGYGAAQAGTGLHWITEYWPGATFAEKASHLHVKCAQAQVDSTLDAAAQDLLSLQLSSLQTITHTPLDQLDHIDRARLDATMSHAFLQRELGRCLELLSEVALQSTVTWLREQGVTTFTLIPSGMLAAFPLLAVPMNDDPQTSGWQTVADVLPASIAPSVRSLLVREQPSEARSGLYSLGDPRPTHLELRWGEAEAHSVALLGGDPEHARVHEAATRDWLIEKLRQGLVVDASCHGRYNFADFLRSELLLANHETLSLSDALSYIADLSGLRLLILSACQTAILDLRGAHDEVRSIAVAMLQAGAKAVMATLWSVDDRATYLLMVRFVQEWFPFMEQEPPAKALARAQHWLRTATLETLQKWEVAPTRKSLTAIGQGKLEAVVQDPEEQLAVTRGRGERYTLTEAEHFIQGLARRKQSADPNVCPYADPIYWAGFQVYGW